MKVLACDLGASSGRAMVGRFDGSHLQVEEIHRFSNDPVQVGDRLYWDILRIYWEVERSFIKARQAGHGDVASFGIDSWAVDFGLLDKNGELLGNPFHYRDRRTDGVMEKVLEIVPREEIYRRTGIQFMPINTINQLYALKLESPHVLEQAAQLLMIPDLLRYFLTGEKLGEKTNASTTQLFHVVDGTWDEYILDKLALPKHIFPVTADSGEKAGYLRKSIQDKVGLGALPVYTVGEHDTASAVVAVPSMEKDFVYLSCGTWSLLGTEIGEPILTDEAREWNLTNERGVNKTYRFLKNIMGLWLLQECMRVWEREGECISYDELDILVDGAKPLVSFIDPDHEMFLKPRDMPSQIQHFCREANQPVPQNKGEMIRCILESLALKYRYVLEQIERLTNKTFYGLYMVGGGIKNKTLCQYTANAIGRPVWAGPVEATALGNMLVQYIALGKISNIREAREIVRRSFQIEEYVPEATSLWNEAYERFLKVITLWERTNDASRRTSSKNIGTR